MPQCNGIKRDGTRCTVIVGAGQSHCYQHDPRRAEDRRRNASKGGKSKGNQRLAKLDRQLEDLASDALEGKVERGIAAVVNQIINTRVRLLEVERKLKEQEELEERLAALEVVLKTRRAG